MQGGRLHAKCAGYPAATMPLAGCEGVGLLNCRVQLTGRPPLPEGVGVPPSRLVTELPRPPSKPPPPPGVGTPTARPWEVSVSLFGQSMQ